MNDKKKQLNQIILLTALLLLLGFLMFRMFSIIGGGRGQSASTQQAEEQQPATTRVTAMGTVVTEGEISVPDFVKEQGLVGSMNTNIFRVHGISSPRNPFKRNDAWYQEHLDNIPGTDLPETFLEEMNDEVPNLNELFGTDREFVAYSMEKSMQEDDYSFTGTSDDGRITTNIQARTKTEPTIRVEYSEAEGREVEQVDQPDAAADGLPRPGGDDIFGNSGMSAVRPPKGGEPGEPAFSCLGISIKGDNRSALLRMPDGTKLIMEGDVLMPFNIKVIRISEKGVELQDIRSAEQLLIPLAQEI